MSLFNEVILPSADLFAVPPVLRFKGRNKLHSTCGLFLTLSVLAFSGWLLWYLARDLLQHKNPVISQLTLFNGAVKPLSLDPEHNTFAFGLLDQVTWENFIDPSIYTVKAGMYIEENAAAGIARQFIDLELETCASKLHPGDIYCWKPYTPSGDPVVLGVSADMIYFQFNRCVDGATTDVSCESDDTIDDILSNSHLQVETDVWNVDPVLYTDNFNSSFSPVDYALNSRTYNRKVIFHYGKITLQSTDGFLLTSPTITERVTRTDTSTDTSELTGPGFLNFNIHRAGAATVYYKKYQQVQEMLASFTGLLSTVILIVGIIALPYVKFKSQEFFVKSCFNVRTRGVQSFDLLPGSPPKKTKVQSEIDKPKNTEERERKGLNVSFFKWLLSCIRPQPEVKVLQRGLAEILPQADMITLIKLSQKVDRMKACLMTEEQRAIFDNLESPEIFIDVGKSGDGAIEVFNLPVSYAGDKGKVEKAAEAIRANANASEVDRRVIDLYKQD